MPDKCQFIFARQHWRAVLIFFALAVHGPSCATDQIEYVSDRSYEETVQHLQWAFGGYGMTTVTAMDFQEVLKKMKVQTGRAAIFEVMRRDWAKTLLEEDRTLGAVLPLRLYIFEDSNGKTLLNYEPPSRTLKTHPSEKLRALGRLLDEKIESVVLQATEKRRQ